MKENIFDFKLGRDISPVILSGSIIVLVSDEFEINRVQLFKARLVLAEDKVEPRVKLTV